MFYRQLTPLEQAHIVEAFTFEMEQVLRAAPVKERDSRCARRRGPLRQVAAGWAYPPLKGRPAEERSASTALSQVGD